MPFNTGNSESVIETPNSSSDSSEITARSRAGDLHTGQLGLSRSIPSGGLSHSVPQILQRNFPESENVKRSPPVTIVNDLNRHFFVSRAGGRVFEQRALLRHIGVLLRVRDE